MKHATLFAAATAAGFSLSQVNAAIINFNATHDAAITYNQPNGGSGTNTGAVTFANVDGEKITPLFAFDLSGLNPNEFAINAYFQFRTFPVLPEIAPTPITVYGSNYNFAQNGSSTTPTYNDIGPASINASFGLSLLSYDPETRMFMLQDNPSLGYTGLTNLTNAIHNGTQTSLYLDPGSVYIPLHQGAGVGRTNPPALHADIIPEPTTLTSILAGGAATLGLSRLRRRKSPLDEAAEQEGGAEKTGGRGGRG